MDAEKPIPQNKEDTYIQWHAAFVEALRLELERYKDALQFMPEYQLTTEPLRVDIVIIKKSKDVTIDKNIAAMFRTDNLVEYKSPESYVSVKDFYKVYGYACLYAYLNNVPITEITISFVENHYPRDLLAHLKKVQGYHVEEKSPGIYTVTGDIIPIQIIDSRRLSAKENLWLKDLTNTLDAPEIRRITEEIKRRGKDTQIWAYLEAVYTANLKKMKEAFKMSDATLTLDKVLEEIGLTAQWEARGEARGEERKALKIAKNLLAKGYPVEDLAEATGLEPKTVRKLAKK
jgi:hypothetical protein